MRIGSNAAWCWNAQRAEDALNCISTWQTTEKAKKEMNIEYEIIIPEICGEISQTN